jgi:hypothetical protein
MDGSMGFAVLSLSERRKVLLRDRALSFPSNDFLREWNAFELDNANVANAKTNGVRT